MVKLQNKLSSVNKTNIISKQYSSKGRFMIYVLSNEIRDDNLLTLRSIYNTLFKDEEFIKFGFHKVIIISAINGNQEYSYHHNILINNNTSFQDYYNKVKDYVNLILSVAHVRTIYSRREDTAPSSFTSRHRRYSGH